MASQPRRTRQLHRLVVPIAAAPLALTALSGGIYGTMLGFNIDAPWLLRLHTGNFGILNLQPYYAPLLSACTLILIASGISLYLSSGRPPGRPSNRGTRAE
jgi:hypothetical protein